MAETLLDHLFHFAPVLRRRPPPDCETIWLLGSSRYGIEVAGTARHQSHLQHLMAGQPREHSSRLMLASLRRAWCEARHREGVDIAVGGDVIGYCPSHLSTRFCEWLRQWQLEEAEVWCSVRLYRGRERESEPGLVSAHLDIDLPFAMKTVDFPPEQAA